MTLLDQRRGWNWVVLAVLLLAAGAVTAETKHEAPVTAPSVVPTVRIEVGPLGYVAPSPAYLDYKMGLVSLDFIDSGHLLFTFHSNGLMRRIPGDPADDDDQVIHAEVLEIASGKVLRQTDWRMHDKGRYLWALQDGKFLVRQRNSLFLTDSSLELRPYLTFDTNLQGVEVSPGRTLMVVETQKFLAPGQENDAEGDVPVLTSPSLVAPEEHRQKRTEILLLRPGGKTALAEGEMLHPVTLPLLEDGFLDVIEGKQPKQWVVEKKLLNKTTEEIGDVQSSCTPELVPLSEKAVLAQDCPLNGIDGNAVSALSLAGGVLWEGLWQSKYIWGTFDFALDGSRFAYGSLEMSREVGAFDSFGEADVVAQPVGVFDTESGKLELVKDASPILSGGQNYALSADGRRFAILRAGAIEVYDLPAVEMKGPSNAKK
jgi:hypothetical protein